MQVSKAVKQKLPAGAQALIQWAEENNYSPVTSYTSTDVANIFHLRVREKGACVDYMDVLKLHCAGSNFFYNKIKNKQISVKVWEFWNKKENV